MNVIGTLALVASCLLGTILFLFRKTRNLGLSFILLAGGCIVFLLLQSHNWETAFEAIMLGNSEHNVISKMGTPQRITDGTLWVEPEFKKGPSELVPGCMQEYWYNAFLFPEAYSFCFNKDAVLIQKYKWAMW